MFHCANADDDGNFNYVEFTKTIKHGEKDDWLSEGRNQYHNKKQNSSYIY